MVVLSEHEWKRVVKVFEILGLGIIFAIVFHVSLFYAVGVSFAIMCVIDIIFMVIGRFIVRIIYTEVIPKSVRELKHTDKQYQYILKLECGKEIYSYVYGVPLDKVRVRCWKYAGMYLIEVTSATRSGADGKSKIK